MDVFDVAIILISYRLDILCPPPSLRDISAGREHAITFFAITTQSHAPGFAADKDRVLI
jgi:hypothetical protein